jgi:hypothetical protein
MNLRVGSCDHFMVGSCWPMLYIGGPVLVLRWFMLFYSGPYISCDGSCWLMLVTTFYDDLMTFQRWFMSVGVNFRLFSSWFMLACAVHIFYNIFSISLFTIFLHQIHTPPHLHSHFQSLIFHFLPPPRKPQPLQ